MPVPDPQTQSHLLEVISIISVVLSPLIAVIITIWYQNRQSKRAAQMQLFMDLVAFRDYHPIPWQYSVALNRIGVVFYKHPAVVRLWHEYYDILLAVQEGDVVTRREVKKIELLSEIARVLGYKDIPQLSLLKYYQPKGSWDDSTEKSAIQKELLRVLKSTEVLFLLGKYAETQAEKDFKDGKIERRKLSDEDPLNVG